jgi:hypothetical protein
MSAKDMLVEDIIFFESNDVVGTTQHDGMDGELLSYPSCNWEGIDVCRGGGFW